MPKNKKNKIIELDKEHLRDLDGVTMDLESYAKHTKPQIKTKNEPVKQTETKNETKQPIGVFACNPVHIGWYTTGETKQQINYPIMAGAIKPNQEINNLNTYYIGSGSYLSSGSFLTSYLTSYLTLYLTSYITSYTTSYLTSYLTSFSSSFVSSGDILAHGYGLELI